MIRRPTFTFTLALAAALASAPLTADDLTGAERFLCTAAQVTACYDDGECLTVPPWELNIPQFIEVDLEARTLATPSTQPPDLAASSFSVSQTLISVSVDTPC